MIQKLISWSLFFCMIISLFLALAGVQEVTPDKNFYVFFTNVANKFNGWQDFKIPDIPLIPEGSDGGRTIIEVLRNFANAVVTVLNVLILITNVVISVIKFLIALIWCCVDYFSLLTTVTP